MKKLTLVFVCILLSGCYDIVLDEENNEYETIDGLWRVSVETLENTCNPEEEFEAFDTQMYVTVQEWPEEGGYIADFFLADLVWRDVKVEENGDFLYRTDYGIFVDVFEGNIIPGLFDATFGLEMETADFCSRMILLNGYQPYNHTIPPEGFEK